MNNMVEVKKFFKKPEKIYPIEIGLPDFIRKLFPETQKTETAEIVSQLVADIYPLCRPHKAGLTKEIIVKGSTVKRYLLGDPDGYWDISRIYGQVDTDQLQGDSKRLVERFAMGPRDIDFRYQLEEGKQDEDVRQALIYSLLNQGFSEEDNDFHRNIRGKNYRAVIEQTEIGGTNGPPRLFFNVLIHVNGKFLLRCDFGRLPDLTQTDSDHHGQRHDEFRVSPFFPIEETDAYGQIIVNKSKVTLGMNKNLIESFDNPWSVKLFYFIDKLPLILMGKLKGIGFRTFWPEIKGKGDYDYEKILLLFLNAGYADRQPWINQTYDANLEKRKMEYVSDFLLYLTYDPFLFLHLLADLNFLPIIPLSEYITTPEDLSLIMFSIAHEIDQKTDPDEINSDANLRPEKYSRLYKEKVLNESNDIRDTGPFMLIRAINKLLRRNGRVERIEQSFDSLINLFDPNKSELIKRWFLHLYV